MLHTHEQRQVNATIQKCQNSREAKRDKNSQEITIYYYKIVKIHEIIFYKITITPCYNKRLLNSLELNNENYCCTQVGFITRGAQAPRVIKPT